ncbi:Os12g0532600 [Oryza sativa Japonica Group]|uniref:Os12g0532600 protein n=1 Tax=Oryza sativa subsp. japonica TaxID=39947 RepID=Q0IMX4_ORYSJ|nr:hypothetical protein DAI22_12g160300 [Oryza sativa Japonica Group]BAF29941.1 Os12g0532600 [Oryza sativa Japonica Group]|eukprot:NP_001066922.1 Os12g0532600 [Oryza sativa Japonica Group]
MALPAPRPAIHIGRGRCGAEPASTSRRPRLRPSSSGASTSRMTTAVTTTPTVGSHAVTNHPSVFLFLDLNRRRCSWRRTADGHNRGGPPAYSTLSRSAVLHGRSTTGSGC